MALKKSIFGAFLGLLMVQPSAASDPLLIGYNSDWAPYSSGGSDRIRGVLPDILDEILEFHMGIKVRHVGYPWKRVQKAVETGSIDAMITVPTKTRTAYAYRSQEVVYQIEMRGVVKAGSPSLKKLGSKPMINTLRNLKSCEIIGSGWGQLFYNKHKIQPIMANNVDNCLRMVAGNHADVTIRSTVVANRHILSENLQEKLVVMPKVWGALQFALLLSKKSKYGPNFLKQFDQVLKAMKTSGTYRILVERTRKLRPAS